MGTASALGGAIRVVVGKKCRSLAIAQHDDGAYGTRGGGVDALSLVSASFALLFLSVQH